MTVQEALADLRAPGAGDFFGRIDTIEPVGRRAAASSWYIGRRHIEDDQHEPVVVDWRAPIAAPVLPRHGRRPARRVAAPALHARTRGAATHRLPRRAPRRSRCRRRRRRHPRPGARRDRRRADRGDARDRGDDPGRAGRRHPRADRPGAVVQGGPGTGKTAVALHRAAYLLFEHRRRLVARRRARHRAEPGVPRLHRQRAAVARRAQRAPVHGARPVRARRSRSPALDDPTSARAKGDAAMLDELAAARRCAAITPPARRRRRADRRRAGSCSARDEIAEWLDRATDARRSRSTSAGSGCGRSPSRSCCRRTGRDDVWPQAGPLRKALDAAWPTQQPIRLVDRLLADGRRRRASAGRGRRPTSCSSTRPTRSSTGRR